jgi:hypothetical protein
MPMRSMYVVCSVAAPAWTSGSDAHGSRWGASEEYVEVFVLTKERLRIGEAEVAEMEEAVESDDKDKERELVVYWGWDWDWDSKLLEEITTDAGGWESRLR